VDPDRWEFANEWFLRGQKQLLRNIVRKKHNRNSCGQGKYEDLDEEEMVMEIARLKQDQQGLEEELQGMNKRLEATERRPQQMMAFLSRVVDDPGILPRMMLQKEGTRQLASEKKRRLMIPSASLSSSMKTEDEEEGTLRVISSSPETGFEIDNFREQSSPETPTPTPGWVSQRPVMGRSQISQEPFGCAAIDSPSLPVSSDTAGFGNGIAVSPPDSAFLGYGNISGGKISYFTEMAATSPLPYPFSLLGGGF
jgi:heat shock transcription factor